MEEDNPVGLNPIRDYVDDQVLTPTVQLAAAIHNPNTGDLIEEQRATGAGYLNQALDTATRVHESGQWRDLSIKDRAAILEAMADALEARIEDIAQAESLTTGIVIRQSRALAKLVPHAFKLAAQQISQVTETQTLSSKVTVQHLPWGPSIIITPWSAGSVAASHKVASALAAACPVILKPSEWAPHACDIIAETIIACGLPPGTFQLVHGGEDVGKVLINDPRSRAVSFAGTIATGRHVFQDCAADFKPVQLEFGGVNPLIVMQDADIDDATEGVVTALTLLNGQWHRGLGRLLVHQDLYNPLLRKVLDRLETLHIGDSTSPDSDIGPLIHDTHRQNLQEQINHFLSCGSVVHEAGHLPDSQGTFMRPALVTNCPADEALDEIFGPIATVHMFKDGQEAVALANQPRATWSAYIFCADETRAQDMANDLQASNVSINGVRLYGLHPNAPRSAWGLTGWSEGGVAQSIQFFLATRAIGIASA